MLFPDLPTPEPKTEIARRIFAYWQAVTNHPRGRMDAKRQNLITARLTDGYSEDDLKLAALGIASCPWNQGQNPERKVYDSIELCYRNADKVDHFMREGELAMKRQARFKQVETVPDVSKSTTGEEYQRQRGVLLKIVGKGG